MRNAIAYLVVIFMIAGSSVFGQKVDSSMYKKYSFQVGNLGFAADSLELLIPDVPQGELTEYPLEVFNFGAKPIVISDGKSARFVKIKNAPLVLMPGSFGTLTIELDIVKELPFGPFRGEVSLDTDDETAKYKFLYLLTNVVKGTGGSSQSVSLDTIPRLFFSEYNYDFGHLYRGIKLYHSFKYTNAGGRAVVINHIEVSPDCKLVVSPPEIIQPGESGFIRLKVIMRGRIGVQHRTVVLNTNDPITPVITLGIHGNVRSDAPSKKNPDFCNEKPGFF